MTLKVIGAGLGRTGTSSLCKALEILGFGPCYHMNEIRNDRQKIDDWLAVQAGRPDWDKIYQNYQATTDFPGCLYYQELRSHYSDAKVILTVRDPEKWYQSVYETIFQISQVVPQWFLKLSPAARKLKQMVTQGLDQGLFDNRFEDKDHAISVFKRHVEAVKNTVPPEKLLVYEIHQGWEPLCKFLNVPVPEGQPFPSMNDLQQMKKTLRTMKFVFKSVEVATVALAIISVVAASSQTKL